MIRIFEKVTGREIVVTGAHFIEREKGCIGGVTSNSYLGDWLLYDKDIDDETRKLIAVVSSDSAHIVAYDPDPDPLPPVTLPKPQTWGGTLTVPSPGDVGTITYNVDQGASTGSWTDLAQQLTDAALEHRGLDVTVRLGRETSGSPDWLADPSLRDTTGIPGYGEAPEIGE